MKNQWHGTDTHSIETTDEPRCVSGIIVDPGHEPFPGYVCWENGIITECDKGSPPFQPVAKGLITPLFINGHTHIGDSIFFGKIDPSLGLERIVNPPYGVKHILLSSANDEDIIHGMERSLGTMTLSGIGQFLDFREGGKDGIRLLELAYGNHTERMGMELPQPHIFSRPSGLNYDREEIDQLCQLSGGIGISSVLDWDYSELEKVAEHVHRCGKLLAIHASETQREDIDGILDLQPEILVHLTAATPSDIERVADADIDVVICPRTNSLFGFLPDIPLMLEKGLRLTLGTDNFMFTDPDPIKEMSYTLEISMDQNRKNCIPPSPADILKMTGFHMKKVLNVKSGISAGQKSGFMVLAMGSGQSGIALRTLIRGSKIHTIVDGASLRRQ